MPREERVRNVKIAVAFAIGFAAYAIAAPVISFHCPENWDAIPYLAAVGLMFLQMLGQGPCLVFPVAPRNLATSH